MLSTPIPYFVSLQIYVKTLNEKIFVVNKRLYEMFPDKTELLNNLKLDFEQRTSCCTRVLYIDLDENSNYVLNGVLLDVYKAHNMDFPKNILLLVYYSVKDLCVSFGYENIKPAMLRGCNILQNMDTLYSQRNLKGHIFNKSGSKYKIFDVYGFVGNSSLKNVADSVGVNMMSKHQLDCYKKQMHKPLLSDDPNLRSLFLKYSMDDVTKLYDVWKKRVDQHNLLLESTLGLSQRYLVPDHQFPSTVGSLIAKTFLDFISFTASKSTDLNCFKRAICKVGYLNILNKGYQKDHLDDRQAVYKHDNYDPDLISRHCTSDVYAFDAINQGSIPCFLTCDKKTMTPLLAMVTGGRCTNERYRENRFENVLDLDLSSCYGTALAKLVYPIGKPRIYATSINNRGITLKKFLKEYRAELIPGLYKIVVQGELTFEQDLIYSKVLSTGSQQSFFDHERDWFLQEDHLNTDHVLIKKEIINGVITSDILQVIENVSSSKELVEFLDLEVKAAAYWSKTDRVETIKKWCDIVNRSNKPEDQIFDWVGISIGDYINPLIAERKRVKEQMKVEKDEERKSQLHGLQTSLKLSINTLYGCLSSRFFRIGNSVLADNITAKPRAAIWLAVKALGGAQVITDGFASPNVCLGYVKSGVVLESLLFIPWLIFTG